MKKILLFLVIFLLVFNFYFCEGETEGTTTEGTDEGTTTEGTDEGTTTEVKKDSVIVALGAIHASLYPHDDVYTPLLMSSRNIYSKLLRRDKDTNIIPGIAKSFELISDNTWQFKLRKGIQFTNGEELNAEAVKFSLDRWKNGEGSRSKIFADFESIEIIDDYTINIITNTPARLPSMLAVWSFIFPPKYFEEVGKDAFAQSPIGSGAYKVVEFTSLEKIALEANENYWEGKPQVKQFTFIKIVDHIERVEALLEGKVDIIANVRPSMSLDIQKAANTEVKKTATQRVVFVCLNTFKEDSPLKNKKVRQALNYAVDRKGIVEVILSGNGIQLGTTVSKYTFGYTDEVKPYPYDPEKAKSLLKEAGYENGFTLDFASTIGRYMNDEAIAQAIQKQLEDIGLKVNLELLERKEYSAKVKKPVEKEKPDMFLIGWGNIGFDANADLVPFYTTGGSQYVVYKNEETEKLIKEAGAELDVAKREKTYNEIIKIFYDEAPMLYLHQQMDIWGINKDVHFEPRVDEFVIGYDISF